MSPPPAAHQPLRHRDSQTANFQLHPTAEDFFFLIEYFSMSHFFSLFLFPPFFLLPFPSFSLILLKTPAGVISSDPVNSNQGCWCCCGWCWWGVDQKDPRPFVKLHSCDSCRPVGVLAHHLSTGGTKSGCQGKTKAHQWSISALGLQAALGV